MVMSVNVKTAQSEIAVGQPIDSRVRPICKLCFGQYVWFASTRFQVVEGGRSVAAIEKHCS